MLIPVFCSQGAEQWLSNHTHVMSSPNEITDCTNTLWHVQTAIPTGHVMAKATAESILDHIQPPPQQKRVIRLSGMVWKRSLMQSFPSRGHFWFTDHFGSCFLFFSIAISESWSRGGAVCLKIKTSLLYLGFPASLSPPTSFIKFSSLIHACSRADVTFFCY